MTIKKEVVEELKFEICELLKQMAIVGTWGSIMFMLIIG
jgi:hypothetical protein